MQPLWSGGYVNSLYRAARSLRTVPFRNIRSTLPRRPNASGSLEKGFLPIITNPLNTNRRRAFSASTPRPRDHHFDTLKFVQRLKDDGFTEEQAVAMMKVLSDVIEERSLAHWNVV